MAIPNPDWSFDWARMLDALQQDEQIICNMTQDHFVAEVERPPSPTVVGLLSLMELEDAVEQRKQAVKVGTHNPLA